MKISDKTAYNIFLKTHDLRGNRELLLSKEMQRNIFLWVLVGHLMFFALPFVLSYLQKFLIPKKQPMITVKLFEDPKPLQPQPPVEKPKPDPPKQEQAKPEPPKEEIKKPEPKVEPPKPEPKKPTQPKQEVKKTEPKPEKPVVKVPAERPKPKWTPVNPNEIKKSNEVVKVDKPAPPSIDSSKLKEKLLKIQDQVKTTPTISAPSGPQPVDYYDKVSAYLYEIWIQPSKMELRGSRPKVIISLAVDASGKVTFSSIKSKSGVPSMDASVDELLKRLSALPPPPSGGMSFDVSLEISE